MTAARLSLSVVLPVIAMMKTAVPQIAATTTHVRIRTTQIPVTITTLGRGTTDAATVDAAGPPVAARKTAARPQQTVMMVCTATALSAAWRVAVTPERRRAAPARAVRTLARVANVRAAAIRIVVNVSSASTRGVSLGARITRSATTAIASATQMETPCPTTVTTARERLEVAPSEAMVVGISAGRFPILSMEALYFATLSQFARERWLRLSLRSHQPARNLTAGWATCQPVVSLSTRCRLP